jgi:type VI secretion system protein ImpA
MQLEPHSPVPYLVQRASNWGQMNTAQLYQELFLDLGGQLNIFEMLGLDASSQQTRT